MCSAVAPPAGFAKMRTRESAARLQLGDANERVHARSAVDAGLVQEVVKSAVELYATRSKAVEPTRHVLAERPLPLR